MYSYIGQNNCGYQKLFFNFYFYLMTSPTPNESRLDWCLFIFINFSLMVGKEDLLLITIEVISTNCFMSVGPYLKLKYEPTN